MDGSFPVSDAVEQAKEAGLRYVSDRKPGFTRRRSGKKFVYFDTKGERITDAKVIARINKLAIPPAYKDVWICPYANGHIQATGKDARGRKQYRYHADWRATRDATKFDHILRFGEKLPDIRAKVHEHLSLRTPCREKVLATVVALLEKTLIRVGNDEYARTNGSYGLTTLRDEHVDVSGQTVRFCFKGKSGKMWNLKLSDRRIANAIRRCQDLGGQELFAWVDDAGQVRDVTSSDVNAYLREISGEAFTAKDFRTFTGTVLAALALQAFEGFESDAQAKRNLKAAIDEVSKRLGNTPAVCRKGYIHPEVINAYLEGSLTQQIVGEIDAHLSDAASLTPDEVMVLAFLKKRLS
ncbi:DNA topoisomerase IB [Asticcacaulis sp. YBE204]|uniref:DNA topoisomerase IB n=1 Tax=Asticcacaulis sp. YBE204 TaxID=1282363 RepID=UPI0003C3E0D3|nr:DNA topoisomerase IB [Asticcacaulis sp. YBE204]ESQ77881.1 hypothetical protein AEYBE204_16515 [Asticcacaulis sp. YBE204]